MVLDSSEAEVIAELTTSDFTSLLPSSSTQSGSKQQPVKEIHGTSTQQATLLDKILVPPKSKPTASTRAITKARVLTSRECLNINREKEMKKKVGEEEKQNRRKKREEKRKEVQKEKAQEKPKRLAEKLQRGEEAKARRLEQRELKLQQQSTELSRDNSIPSHLGKQTLHHQWWHKESKKLILME